MITAKCIKPSDETAGYWLKHNLTVGKEYEVDRIEMGGFYTNVILKEFPNKGYNSVYLKFFEDSKPLDIYSDSRFNPYIK